MPQEPAYAAERRQDAEAKAASERAKNRMFEASVRRRGMGSPELSPHEVESRAMAQPAIHAGDEPRELPPVGEVLHLEPMPR
jgi:hypothetical protein